MQRLQVPAADESFICNSGVHSLAGGRGPLRPLCQWPVSDTHSVLEIHALDLKHRPTPAVTITVLLFYHGPLGPGF